MSKFELDILTPQGYLKDIQHDPNLDVVMNLFKIPRAFSVSGFGDWNVGQHSFCVAFLALYWSRFRGYEESRRNRLMVLALTHDLHEAATGDILPGLKTSDLRQTLEAVQQAFLEALKVNNDPELMVDLKVLDIIAFMYEIRQAQTINSVQRNRLEEFLEKQKSLLMDYCRRHQVDDVMPFMHEVGVF